MNYRAILAGASLMVLSTATAVQAQAQSGTTEPQAGPAFQVDDIIVTARRQAERLQDVPSAVTAFSSETLYRNQTQTLGDLQSLVPNLSLHVGDASNAVIYLRGIGQIDSISFNDPGVGVYLDDVYLGRVQGSFLEVVDPQQIEVLRGPQGTLYGRNTIGGAVKFTSEKPGATPEGYIEAAIGSYDERRLRARLSGPLVSDQLLGSIALAASSRDGYTTNLHDGQSDGDKDMIAGRATLLYQPNDRFSANLTLDASQNRPDRSRTPHRDTPIYSVNTGAMRPIIADPYTVDVTYNDLERLDTSGVALTLTYDSGPPLARQEPDRGHRHGLIDLVRVIRERKIQSIAIPPLGSGLGGLNWSDVRPRVEAALAELTDVRTLIYEPVGTTRLSAPAEQNDP